jgi:hypothetical protein
MFTYAKSHLNTSQPRALLATNHFIIQPELDPTTYAQTSK